VGLRLKKRLLTVFSSLTPKREALLTVFSSLTSGREAKRREQAPALQYIFIIQHSSFSIHYSSFTNNIKGRDAFAFLPFFGAKALHG
jgi:hypothetical protein